MPENSTMAKQIVEGDMLDLPGFSEEHMFKVLSVDIIDDTVYVRATENEVETMLIFEPEEEVDIHKIL